MKWTRKDEVPRSTGHGRTKNKVKNRAQLAVHNSRPSHGGRTHSLRSMHSVRACLLYSVCTACVCLPLESSSHPKCHGCQAAAHSHIGCSAGRMDPLLCPSAAVAGRSVERGGDGLGHAVGEDVGPADVGGAAHVPVVWGGGRAGGGRFQMKQLEPNYCRAGTALLTSCP